jgi:hypothetical protein
MSRPRRLVAATLVGLLALGALAAACSDDGDEGDGGADQSLVMPSTTTTTIPVGGGTAPTSTFLPNTPIIAGQEAILTGAYSQEQVPGGGVSPSADEGVCHYVTSDDGARVSVAFTDTYLYDGVAYPGPADYPGDPEQYPNDPLLVHPGDRIAVRGEVVEAGDDPCATPTAQPGLTILVSTFAPS